jgi:hypothetical protein
VRVMGIRTYLSTVAARPEAEWWPAVLAIAGVFFLVGFLADGFGLLDLALPAVIVGFWLYLLLAPRR